MNTESRLADLPIVEIDTTAGTQTRKEDKARWGKYVSEYAGDMRQGNVFPELDVFSPKGSERYILADGFHRLEAAKSIGQETIACRIYEGDVRDAKRFAIEANQRHGIRLSIGDKRRKVRLALEDPEWGQYSNREIARMCGVSHTFVAKIHEDRLFEGKKEKPSKAHATGAEDDAGGNVATSDVPDAGLPSVQRHLPRTQREVNRDDAIAGGNQWLKSWPEPFEDLAKFDNYANIGLVRRIRISADDYIKSYMKKQSKAA